MEVNVFKTRGIYNKRNYDRLDFIREVQYKVLRRPFTCVFSQNISAKGMCLLLDDEFNPGTVLELNFNIPGQKTKTISTYSKVVWQKDYLTGVEFIGQSENH
jgi:hypothetical protein